MQNTRHTSDELVLTIVEAAKRLKISEWMVHKLIQEGSLRSVKVGSRRLIPTRDLATFIEDRRSAGDEHA